MSWPLSCDLTGASREHRLLLRAVHTCGRALYTSGPDLDAAIDSYRKEFIPSLNHACKSHGEGTGNFTIPSIDVAWVWHIHKLDPVAYCNDCMRAFGEVLQSPPGISPFQFSTNPPKPSQASPDSSLDFEVSCDIAASAKRQAVFLWHVRGALYDDEAFLNAGVVRYSMMLGLMRRHPDQFIVPTFDMDLMWHTHLAFPRDYATDCHRLVGRLVCHDDTVGDDRSAQSKLSSSTAATRSLFRKAYGYTWEKDGAMHCGTPPPWYWTDRQRAVVSDETAWSSLSRTTLRNDFLRLLGFVSVRNPSPTSRCETPNLEPWNIEQNRVSTAGAAFGNPLRQSHDAFWRANQVTPDNHHDACLPDASASDSKNRDGLSTGSSGAEHPSNADVDAAHSLEPAAPQTREAELQVPSSPPPSPLQVVVVPNESLGQQQATAETEHAEPGSRPRCKTSTILWLFSAWLLLFVVPFVVAGCYVRQQEIARGDESGWKERLSTVLFMMTWIGPLACWKLATLCMCFWNLGAGVGKSCCGCDCGEIGFGGESGGACVGAACGGCGGC